MRSIKFFSMLVFSCMLAFVFSEISYAAEQKVPKGTKSKHGVGPSSITYSEEVTNWNTEYSKTIKLLPELQKQASFRGVSISCKSMLRKFHSAMKDADQIVLSKNPDKAKSNKILLKLKQVRIELERVMTDFSKAESKAYKADLARKRWEMTEEAILDNEIEEAKSSYETVREKFKLSIKILTEHLERQTQVIQKITS